MAKEHVTYNVKLTCLTPETRNLVQSTIQVYRQAVSFVIGVVEMEWEQIAIQPTEKKRVNYVQRLIHETKGNDDPLYGDFDYFFPNFPCYLRRAAIQAAIGALSTYHTNCF